MLACDSQAKVLHNLVFCCSLFPVVLIIHPIIAVLKLVGFHPLIRVTLVYSLPSSIWSHWFTSFVLVDQDPPLCPSLTLFSRAKLAIWSLLSSEDAVICPSVIVPLSMPSDSIQAENWTQDFKGTFRIIVGNILLDWWVMFLESV